MERLKKASLVMRMIERIGDHRSWCGETHVQKTAYFAQELMAVPLEFDFILYKLGPYSFDLRDELTAMSADEMIMLEPQRPYGTRIAVTGQGQYIQGFRLVTLGKYDHRIKFVAGALGAKGVAELEGLATALYVTRKSHVDPSIDARSREITRLKPHNELAAARSAVEEHDRLKEEARQYLH